MRLCKRNLAIFGAWLFIVIGTFDYERPLLAASKDRSQIVDFSPVDTQDILPSVGVQLVDSRDGEKLMIGSKSYLTITRGKGWDGYYYCADLLRSVFLPGNQFFLLQTPYCANFSGQLLIDTASGRYERLPTNTVVYVTANTATYQSYRISAEGISSR
jgi:hypothetical protein